MLWLFLDPVNAEILRTEGCEYLSIHWIQESIGILLVLKECKICGAKLPTLEL